MLDPDVNFCVTLASTVAIQAGLELRWFLLFMSQNKQKTQVFFELKNSLFKEFLKSKCYLTDWVESTLFLQQMREALWVKYSICKSGEFYTLQQFKMIKPLAVCPATLPKFIIPLSNKE